MLTEILKLKKANSLVYSAIVVITANILLVVASKLTIPFYPVPLTLQTFVVVIFALILAPKHAVLAISLYLFEGAVGLPVFSGTPEKGIGLAYMIGPTGGYLLGFLISTIVLSYIVKKNGLKNIYSIVLTQLLGHAIIYALGLLYLGSLIGYNQKLLSGAFYPFILNDILKLVLGSFVVCYLRDRKVDQF